MKKFFLISLVSIFMLPACTKLCDDSFKIVAIEVSGDELDYHVTRVKEDGQIAHSDSLSTGPLYTVLDDNYHSKIEGMSKTFIFYGYKSNQLIVEEEYVISADECHINRESGVTQVNL